MHTSQSTDSYDTKRNTPRVHAPCIKLQASPTDLKLTASMESRSFALSVQVSCLGALFVESLAVAFVTFSRSDSCTVCSAGKPKAPVFPPAHHGEVLPGQTRGDS